MLNLKSNLYCFFSIQSIINEWLYKWAESYSVFANKEQMKPICLDLNSGCLSEYEIYLINETILYIRYEII